MPHSSVLTAQQQKFCAACLSRDDVIFHTETCNNACLPQEKHSFTGEAVCAVLTGAALIRSGPSACVQCIILITVPVWGACLQLSFIETSVSNLSIPTQNGTDFMPLNGLKPASIWCLVQEALVNSNWTTDHADTTKWEKLRSKKIQLANLYTWIN